MRTASSAASKHPAGRGRGDDRQRRLAVAPVQRHQQVGGLGLGGHARRGPGALHVDDDQRQLQRHRQADRLGLEVHARARWWPSPRAGPRRRAPSAMFTAAISSSAWTVRTPKRRWRDSRCSSSEAGVIG